MESHGSYHSGVYTKKSALFYAYDGWAIPIEALKEMDDDQRIAFKVSRGFVQTTAWCFREFGKNIHFRPHEPQMVLPRNYWDKMTKREYETLFS